MVTAYGVAEQTKLLKVASSRDGFRAEILEQTGQIPMERARKISTEAGAPVPLSAESEPILLNFREPEPMLEKALACAGLQRNVSQKFHIANYVVVQRDVPLIFAVEAQRSPQGSGKS